MADDVEMFLTIISKPNCRDGRKGYRAEAESVDIKWKLLSHTNKHTYTHTHIVKQNKETDVLNVYIFTVLVMYLEVRRTTLDSRKIGYRK